jgi:hypothetical protein
VQPVAAAIALRPGHGAVMVEAEGLGLAGLPEALTAFWRLLCPPRPSSNLPPRPHVGPDAMSQNEMKRWIAEKLQP